MLRLEQSAREYESKISTLEADKGAIQPLLDSINDIEAEIIRVTNQLQSSEQDQIRAGQAIIGVSGDGLFGGNTRRALVAWVEAQRARITQVQLDVSQLRQDGTAQVDAERTRLAKVVTDIRTTQIPALKDRELTMLAKIDEVRQTESPVIQTARDEIQRLRASAESQVAQSQILIERLRSQLGDATNAQELEADIDAQQDRIKAANDEIDTLTEEKIALEAEYRKLEAEVGPIKYIAEFVYGEQADSNMLEEAVRWVIIIIIFVFDPLAVLLLIAAQYTFDFRRKEVEDDDGERLRRERAEYERARAQRIIDNPVYNIDTPAPPAEEEEEINDEGDNTGSGPEVEEIDGEPTIGTGQQGRSDADGMAMAREDDSGQVEPTKGEIDGTVVEPTDSNIQDGDVELDERDREADDAEGLSGRSDVEPAEEQVSDSDQTEERTSTEQDTGRDSEEEELEEVIHDNGPIGPTPVTFKPRKTNIDITAREVEYDKKDDDQTYVDAKTAWKEDNPEETLKPVSYTHLRAHET
mgnify:CR=1 FL=1